MLQWCCSGVAVVPDGMLGNLLQCVAVVLQWCCSGVAVVPDGMSGHLLQCVAVEA